MAIITVNEGRVILNVKGIRAAWGTLLLLGAISGSIFAGIVWIGKFVVTPALDRYLDEKLEVSLAKYENFAKRKDLIDYKAGLDKHLDWSASRSKETDRKFDELMSYVSRIATRQDMLDGKIDKVLFKLGGMNVSRIEAAPALNSGKTVSASISIP